MNRIKPIIILGILGLVLITAGCFMESAPRVNPTETPTISPTMPPTVSPGVSPTMSPSVSPGAIPTILPTMSPSISPGAIPTILPTMAPTITPAEQYVEDVVSSLKPGQIMFNPPQEMTAGVKERVEVRISKDLQDNITAGLTGRGTPQKANISVGTFMTVNLTGDNFEITELSNKEQLVTGDRLAEWDFDVTPLKHGDQNLELRATIRIMLPDGKVEHIDHPVFDRRIKVNVNPVYSINTFIGENWKWIFTTLFGGTSVLGIIAVVIGRLKKKNTDDTNKAEPKSKNKNKVGEKKNR
jgi:hypothetical protein